MKIKLEIDKSLKEKEIIIKVPELNQEVLELEKTISSLLESKKEMVFYKDDHQYFLSLDQIIFFESGNKKVQAHTIDQVYEVDYKLYQLEEILPSYFLRISKSSIANLRQVASIQKNLASSSKIGFYKSHKVNYVSRSYYKFFREKIERVKR